MAVLEFCRRDCSAAGLFDGVALWFAREQFVPVLLLPEKGLPVAKGRPSSFRSRLGLRKAAD